MEGQRQGSDATIIGRHNAFARQIGNDVFVGNGSTISKGTIIPNGCVISCISKVSGDFTKHGEHLLISGNPATVVKTGIGITNGWYLREEYEVALKVESTI